MLSRHDPTTHDCESNAMAPAEAASWPAMRPLGPDGYMKPISGGRGPRSFDAWSAAFMGAAAAAAASSPIASGPRDDP